MTGGVNKIKLVGLSVSRDIFQRYALRLDGDSTLPLKIHGVENLLSHLAIGQPTAMLNETVSKRGFTVIDMGNDREISYVAECRHKSCP